ncbi:MAG TPA: hypothetical protein VGE16_09125 [Albitalea sp.]
MLSRICLFLAVGYLVVGVTLGMYAGITQDFRLTHVHVHLNLLGWVTLGLVGLLYGLHPHLQAGWLPRLQLVMHNVGLVSFMGGIGFGLVTGDKVLLPVVVGASLVAAGIVTLAVHVVRRLR